MLLMLIEDDVDDQEIFRYAIDRIPGEHTILMFENGREALDYLCREALVMPDHIFLDLNMPLMDGREMLWKLKEHPVLKKIAVTVFTNSLWKKDSEFAQMFGAKHYIIKPSSMNSVVDSVKYVLETATMGR
jgi:CheY-like chemotaxis protein